MSSLNKRRGSPTISHLSDENLVFYRNVDKMRKRLPKITFADQGLIHRPPIPLYKEYFVVKENRNFSNKIYNIRDRLVKPEINIFHIETEKRLLDYKQRQREIEKRIITEENKKYKEKVFNQRSIFCSEAYLGRDYQDRHDKLIAQICQIRPNESVILPPIKDKRAKKKEKTISTIAPEPEVVENENENDKSIEGKDLNQQTQGIKQKRTIEENNQRNGNAENNEECSNREEAEKF